MGNLQVIYFIKNHGDSKKYPKINKLVAIAGTIMESLGWMSQKKLI